MMICDVSGSSRMHVQLLGPWLAVLGGLASGAQARLI
jgi:hypothetical protein